MKGITMRYLILFILALTLFIPSVGQAQTPQAVAIAPCLPDATVSLVRQTGTVEFGEDWAKAAKDPYAIYTLAGAQVGWLGYADQNSMFTNFVEWYGFRAAYAGVNQLNYGEASKVFLYGEGVKFSDKPILGRIEVREYPVTNEYILWITGLEQYGLPDGTRNDFHPLDDPRGGSCVFRVPMRDFNAAMGGGER